MPGTGGSTSGGGRISVNSGARSLDAFEAAVLALNLPASSSGVNYQFSQGSYICVPNLYSSSGAQAASWSALRTRVLTKGYKRPTCACLCAYRSPCSANGSSSCDGSK